MKTEWHWDPVFNTWNIRGKHCWIWMDARPAYCDRGRWLARLEISDPVAIHIDGADGWPRYYFNLERAKAEIEEWIRFRKQWIE